MPESWKVSYAAMAVMALVSLFTVVFPLCLGAVFWRRRGGRWRFFLLGCVYAAIGMFLSALTERRPPTNSFSGSRFP